MRTSDFFRVHFFYEIRFIFLCTLFCMWVLEWGSICDRFHLLETEDGGVSSRRGVIDGVRISGAVSVAWFWLCR